ncbi:hypothetical protein ACFL9U_03870, partial [Thermodesulfobacteriota bacterium]
LRSDVSKSLVALFTFSLSARDMIWKTGWSVRPVCSSPTHRPIGIPTGSVNQYAIDGGRNIYKIVEKQALGPLNQKVLGPYWSNEFGESPKNLHYYKQNKGRITGWRVIRMRGVKLSEGLSDR